MTRFESSEETRKDNSVLATGAKDNNQRVCRSCGVSLLLYMRV